MGNENGSGRCTLTIENATIIDGSGADAYRGGVAIDGDRIVAVGDVSGWRADARVDARGKVLAPGFIDCHTHDDRAVLATPEMAFKVSQGVTSVVAGNCGISLAPFSTGNGFPPPFPLLGEETEFRFPTVAAYREELERRRPAVNIALLAGHSSLRVAAMGQSLDRAATKAEIEHMRDLLILALRQGCIGFSSGLDYPPANAAPADEIIALAGELRGFERSVYATHIRNEGDQVVEAVRETIETGRRTGASVIISHHKCAGPRNYGRSRETLALIAEAQKTQKLALDVYPYTASSTILLADHVRETESVLVTFSKPHPEMAGRSLDDIVAEWGCAVEEAIDRLYPAGAVYFQMDEDDLERIMASPGAMIGSDGLPGQTRPHPRLWGTFPRVLSRYVRDRSVLRLEEAVHRMTGLTAQTFGLDDRGSIAPGAFADLVVFDAQRIEDAATYDDPEQPAHGIDRVFVSGTPVWQDGRATGHRPGRFLQR